MKPSPLSSLSDTAYFLDGFCGGGGASLGIKIAGEVKDPDGKVIANTIKVAVAINHNERAIWAHTQNHPETLHLNDDIRKVDIPALAVQLIAKGIRRMNIWWSAECTHFSNAKGGASRDADSRMLSEELLRYVIELQANGIVVDAVFVENVREFFTWTALLPKAKGAKRLRTMERRYVRVQLEMFDAVAAGNWARKSELAKEMDVLYATFQSSGHYHADDQGKITMLPDGASKGQMYLRWVDAMKALGYRYDWKMLNAADFGAYQSRDRYFGVFMSEPIAKQIEAMGEAPIKFPNPTHAKQPKAGGSLFEAGLQKWKACRDILDLDDKGESIFYGRRVKTGPRKGEPMPILVPATLARIAFGIMKFKGEGTMIDRSNTGAIPTSVDESMPTVRASFQNGVVNVTTVDSCTFGQNEVSVNEALPTVMAKRDKYLMNAFVVPTSFTNQAQSVAYPLPCLIAARKHQYLCTPFIAQQFSSEGKPNQVSSVNDPLWSVVTNPKGSLVIPFLSKYYGNGDNATSIESPCGTVTTRDRLGIAQCSFMAYKQGTGSGNSDRRVSSHDSPMNVVKTCFTPTSIQCQFAVYYHGGKDAHSRAQHLDEPMKTLGTENYPHTVSAQVMPLDDNWPIILRHAPKLTKNGNMIVPAWSRVVNGYQVDNRVIDIHYRMLKVDELKLAQGFPKSYILDPTSETHSKAMLGNAVHVTCAEELVRVNCGPKSAFARIIAKSRQNACTV